MRAAAALLLDELAALELWLLADELAALDELLVVFA